MPAKGARKPIAERFWPKVERTADCWLWKGGTSSAGYGQMVIEGKPVRAHRISWELTHGSIPRWTGFSDLCVLHKCDNKICVNPFHLFLGTQADNMRDRGEKNRTARKSIYITHCKHGHEFTPENTQWRFHGGYMCRTCVACNRAKSREARARQRALRMG